METKKITIGELEQGIIKNGLEGRMTDVFTDSLAICNYINDKYKGFEQHEVLYFIASGMDNEFMLVSEDNINNVKYRIKFRANSATVN